MPAKRWAISKSKLCWGAAAWAKFIWPATLRALALDPALGAAYASLAVVKHEYDWDWPGAEQDFKRATQLNPNYAPAHQWYAEFLTRMLRFDEAHAEIKRAHELDPLSLIVNSVGGWVYLNQRQPERAVEQLLKTLEMDANFTPAHGYLGLAYQQQGRYPQALAEFRRALELSGGRPRYLANLGVAQALAGQTHAARQTLAELLRLNAQQHVQPFHLASVYTALDEREQAFVWLEKAYQERGVWLLFLHLDPLFDCLHSDARFATLRARVRLPG
ncbi:MAG: tetratricopeptide repeat protein [Acidobacteria bacterium]|nr:tetratricopeptide repeat protein [Acidobacteriota bacterium]